jgi:hypothetical protein
MPTDFAAGEPQVVSALERMIVQQLAALLIAKRAATPAPAKEPK